MSGRWKILCACFGLESWFNQYFLIWLCVFKVSVRRMVAVIDGYEFVAILMGWRCYI